MQYRQAGWSEFLWSTIRSKVIHFFTGKNKHRKYCEFCLALCGGQDNPELLRKEGHTVMLSGKPSSHPKCPVRKLPSWKVASKALKDPQPSTPFKCQCRLFLNVEKFIGFCCSSPPSPQKKKKRKWNEQTDEIRAQSSSPNYNSHWLAICGAVPNIFSFVFFSSDAF